MVGRALLGPLGPLGSLVLVASLISGTGPLSGVVEHRACAAKHHACTTVATVRGCCGHHDGVVNDVTLTSSQADNQVGLTPAASPDRPFALLRRVSQAMARPSDPPTFGSYLPILFGDLDSRSRHDSRPISV